MKRFIEVSSFFSCFLPGTVYSFLAVLNHYNPPCQSFFVSSVPNTLRKKTQLPLDPFWIASRIQGAMGAGVGKKPGCAFERYELYIIKRWLLVSRLQSTIFHTRTIPSLQKSSQKVAPIHEQIPNIPPGFVLYWKDIKSYSAQTMPQRLSA